MYLQDSHMDIYGLAPPEFAYNYILSYWRKIDISNQLYLTLSCVYARE